MIRDNKQENKATNNKTLKKDFLQNKKYSC